MKAWFAVFGAFLALFTGSAFAALPADVTTAITNAGADAKEMALAVLVVLIGIFAVKLIRRGM